MVGEKDNENRTQTVQAKIQTHRKMGFPVLRKGSFHPSCCDKDLDKNFQLKAPVKGMLLPHQEQAKANELI